MNNISFLITIFFLFLLLSFTGYSIYLGFGSPAKNLRDPFDND